MEKVILQLLFGSPALEEQADHFVGSFVRLVPNPGADQQAGYEGHVHLHRHSVPALE
jgi:hypothetical protein